MDSGANSKGYWVKEKKSPLIHARQSGAGLGRGWRDASSINWDKEDAPCVEAGAMKTPPPTG